MKPAIALNPASLAWGMLLAVALAGPAEAQSSPAQALLDESVVGNLGIFVIDTSLKAGLNGASTNNPEVDFDHDFGRADNATRVRADAIWRITPTQHMRFMYFNNTIDKTRTLDQQIMWGDNTYDVGASVEMKTRLSITEVAYEYAFLRNPNYELAASVGVHYTSVHINLSGNATSTDSEGNVTQVSGATSSNGLSAPLPVIGLRGGWAVSEHWYLSALGQYFKASIDGYDGHVTDLGANATWMYNPHFGLGIGYNRFTTSVSVNRASFDGHVSVGYSGVQVFLTGAF
jgi:hypothetical protein